MAQGLVDGWLSERARVDSMHVDVCRNGAQRQSYPRNQTVTGIVCESYDCPMCVRRQDYRAPGACQRAFGMKSECSQ